jgi:hypothetical protein
MEIVTGFEVGSAEERVSQLPEAEYLRMLQALAHNQEVAENVFARTAKKQFKELVDHKVARIRKDELKKGATQWFSESSIMVDLLELRCYSPGAVAGRIASLVHDFGMYILSTIGDDKVLLGSLHTTIIRSGEQSYQFRLKQRWADNG